MELAKAIVSHIVRVREDVWGRDHIEARITAARKFLASLSKQVAMHRKCLRLQKQRSTRLRCR